jgi:hypothetical protein
MPAVDPKAIDTELVDPVVAAGLDVDEQAARMTVARSSTPADA